MDQNLTILLFMTIMIRKQRKLNKKNISPLHYAAINNSKEIGERLIKKGAYINSKTIKNLQMIL